MRKYLFLLSVLLYFVACNDQKNTPSASGKGLYKSHPKLVVGIVVDQMRYDYLPRFWDKYGEGGFKRMAAEGFNCRNHHFNYIPTYTGPGHASVYAGTTPATHGIIANDWYDKETGTMVYCVGDSTVSPLGTSAAAGKMSPRNMRTTSVADQLRLATQMQGKAIGISIKDRGAILPAGHAASAAYWFNPGKEGVFISSSYYMDELPGWVTAFNASRKVDTYMQVWNTLYPIDTYDESGPDDNPYEGKFTGEDAPVFPHDLPKLSAQNGDYGILNYTPFGNSLTTDFAIAAIEGEHLGGDDVTDFLAVSYSATDYAGHRFGVNSKEVQDTYLRLDKDLERLFNVLDENVGKGNYTVFLTADHGAVHVPAYLESVKIPAGYFEAPAFAARLNAFLKSRFKTDKLVKNISNQQLFLDQELIAEAGLEP
ncbi:MAG: alkaline phosphatase family protein, partial [Sinomicrobium sp.]|nr:alkaline phosphatase family protein [Sinomicrobium sp.]